MSIKIFTEKNINKLSTNQNVKNITTKGITYTDKFKQIFILENDKGKFPKAIFEDHGFDIDVIGKDRVESAAKRWRKAYKEEGLHGLKDTRKEMSGRPSEKELSIEQKYERLNAQNKLLKAENEILKKIDYLERRLIRKK